MDFHLRFSLYSIFWKWLLGLCGKKCGNRFGCDGAAIMSETAARTLIGCYGIYVKHCVVGGHFLTKHLLHNSFHTEIKQCNASQWTMMPFILSFQFYLKFKHSYDY